MAVSFAFFLADSHHPVQPGDPLWCAPLPLNGRKEDIGPGGPQRPTYGAYFSAATAFLRENDFSALLCALQATGREIKTPEEIDGVSIFLEKHGAFYHPSRICVSAGRISAIFVLNLAVSAIGIQTAQREYASLCHLREKYDYGLVPNVFAFGRHTRDAGGQTAMFLGEWFTDYHEFHLASDETGRKRIQVWSPRDPNLFLNPAQSHRLFRQIARIHTCHYDPCTRERIFPWHHAAGDFVCKSTGDTVEVRLITVRNYTPMMTLSEDERQDAMSILQGMLVFFLDMSIRIRLDRLDGVGEPVWVPDPVVDAVLEGFFDGVRSWEQLQNDDSILSEAFKLYLKKLSRKDIEDICCEIISRMPKASPDRRLGRRHTRQHAESLYRAIAAA